jgi:hypothetical protein
MFGQTEKSAQFTSKFMVWIAFCILLIELGFMQENVDDTAYPTAASFLLVYLSLGDVLMMYKSIAPAQSKKILTGKVDVFWGLKYLYWSCWWPIYFKK